MRALHVVLASILCAHVAVALPLRAHYPNTALMQAHLANVSTSSEQGQNGKCLKATGGTCMTSKCAGWRGLTECSYGRCFCTSGCTSVDGKCHDEHNKLFLGEVTLRNMRYPEYYMSATMYSSTLKVKKGTPGPESKFDMYLLPGQGQNIEEMVLVSQKYPNYAVNIDREETCDKDGRHCSSTYEGNFRHMSRGSDPSVTTLASKVMQAPWTDPKHAKAFMIGSYQYTDKYLYVGRGSWSVKAYSGDPGTGGYWVADPPLDAVLGPYRGARCSYDCGGAAARGIAVAMLAVLLGLVRGN